jgi:hypothetical protein
MSDKLRQAQGKHTRRAHETRQDKDNTRRQKTTQQKTTNTKQNKKTQNKTNITTSSIYNEPLLQVRVRARV